MPKTTKTDIFRYLSNDAWRSLIAVEMGMRNHEVVPPDLIHKISHTGKRGSSVLKTLKDELVSNRLLAYEVDGKSNFGYRLTNKGYDYLALNSLVKTGHIHGLGAMIGSGKESDVYLAVANPSSAEEQDDKEMSTCGRQKYVVIKLHRLGRVSFRKVREKREYHQHRTKCSWLYLSRLAAKREFEVLKALSDAGLPVPEPIAHNRNAVVMGHVPNAVPLCRLLPNLMKENNAHLARQLFAQGVDLLRSVVELGLVHGDFNEFNLMVSGVRDAEYSSDEDDSEDETGPKSTINKNTNCITGQKENAGTNMPEPKLVLIDFPQVISRDHITAEEIYERDLRGLTAFFDRFFDINEAKQPPLRLSEIKRIGNIDVQLKAPGYASNDRRRSGRSSKTKGAGRQHGSHLDELVLLGATAEATSKLSIISDAEEESEDDDNSLSDAESTDESRTDEDDGDTNDLNYESDSQGQLLKNDIKTNTSSASKEDSVGKKAINPLQPLSKEEIKLRKIRDKRQAERELLRRRVRRNQRASKKQEGQRQMKAEMTLFG